MREWIWLNHAPDVNVRGCFASVFHGEQGQTTLRISAVTRYRVWLNSNMLGEGPIRGPKGVRVFDCYEITPMVCRGENMLAVEVWHHGVSTYQSIAEPAGLAFDILVDGRVVASSGSDTHGALNLAQLSDMPKRNVNLGYTDYLDGRAFPGNWYKDRELTASWPRAVCLIPEVTAGWIEKERPIRPMDRQVVRPLRLVAVEDVEERCHVCSVNLRGALFPHRLDANETTMGTWIGTVLHAPRAMEGVISFPNRTWNGILGDVFLGGRCYPVTDATRGHIPVQVQAGEQLLMIRAAGTFDDLYCHVELTFPEQVKCEAWEDAPFFVMRPLGFVPVRVDGVGLPSSKQALLEEQLKREPLWTALEGCRELAEVCEASGDKLVPVPARDVVLDAYLLSGAQQAKVLARYVVEEENQGILWDNDLTTVIHLPEAGDARRILLDFGTIHVGPVSAVLEAAEGTVIDLYGFENADSHEIDFTPGLNNGMRYICKEGWQSFQGMARLGFRYLLVTVRNASRPVTLRDLHHLHTTYAVTRAGEFACSDMMLTRIFEMCRETNLLCTEDSFTDCPTYEQAFWIGDAYISALVNSKLYGDWAYQLHNAELALSALENTPLMNALTPTDWDTSIPMWMANWILSVFALSEEMGEAGIVERFYAGMVRTLRAYASFITPENGLYLSSWNLLDWAPLDVYDEGVVTAQEGLLAHCMKRAGEYAHRTGRSEDAQQLLACWHILKTHINTVMWDEERAVYRDGWTKRAGFSRTVSVQTHLILYLMDMVPESRRETVEGYLLHTPSCFVQVGSPFILFYLYEALLRFGQRDAVFADIRRRWGEMLKYDATTCWEVFPGFYENGRTRSYCHSWSSSPAYFLLKNYSGLQRLEGSWGKVTLGDLPDDLTWCRASWPTPFGRVFLSWKRNVDGVDAVLELPEGIQYIPVECRDLRVTLRWLKPMSALGCQHGKEHPGG